MNLKNYYPLMLLGLVLVILSSCSKESASTKSQNTSTSTTATSSTGAIAITTASTLAASNSKDSIYLVGCIPGHGRKDTIAFSALPAAISPYLTTNYSGYTFVKAFQIDSASVVNSYIVVIKYNNNYVGLKFSADGTFIKVLEQRAGVDLLGKNGFHPGGPFDNRDGRQRDTIALSAIPSVVTNYFTTTYPTDTLLHASVTRDTTYILISKNNGLFATAVSNTGTLVKRVQLNRILKHTAVTQANLLAAITTYLSTTYPGYVFDKAFAESVNGTVQAYDVFITVNSTKYVVGFNATGTFVKAVALH
ncbi:PepSY-like domain-containing protein [Mucilaginibacter agri]|uniref:Putative beta-lactamase-inhibitor-like PepSY-like domain-containing protein n=1 Tax=Mucilaginibacter agri TaxID=2695265 RepID=A0A965ZEF1_9SPHI|nr:PepSY-like domain-containing protein [Mucilaginibacter agri]NCD69544.1 hypothetical protein [Mucilaginibacter agri]